MKFSSLLAAGILAMGASTAFADGIPVAGGVDAPIVESTDWRGFFISGSIGYGWGNTDLDTTVDQNPGPVFQGSGSGDNDGVIGAVGLGYDFPVGRGFVLGGFVDYTFGELDDRFTDDFGVNLKSSYDDVWAVGGRLGYVVHKDLLLYGTVGYTHAEFEIGNSGGKVSDDLDGYFVGVGLERKICDNIFLKGEYRYSDFDETSISGTSSSGGPCGGSCIIDQDIDHEIHSIRVGVAYKFGSRREEPAPLK